jgi:hypothetical protein
MPTTDPDKAYVKKHKINDMLNELFKSLVADKPENPVDFAFKYFESKVPKKEDFVQAEVKQVGDMRRPEPGAPVNSNTLLAKLLEKQQTRNNEMMPEVEVGVVDNLNVSVAAKSAVSSRVLSQYSIMVRFFFSLNFRSI